jgi:hypothetical protein
MPETKLLAEGNPADVGPDQAQLALLDLSSYSAIRLSAGNWELSPASVVISMSHIDEPNTPNANAITILASITLAPDESVSRVYQVPGRYVALLANPDPPQTGGIKVFFTVYGRTD